MHTARVALLDRVRDVQRTRRLARDLNGIHRQLTRVADALERLSPPTVPLAPNSVEITDPDLAFASKIEAVEADFFKKYHRYPDAEEAARHYEEIEHLL